MLNQLVNDKYIIEELIFMKLFMNPFKLGIIPKTTYILLLNTTFILLFFLNQKFMPCFSMKEKSSPTIFCQI